MRTIGIFNVRLVTQFSGADFLKCYKILENKNLGVDNSVASSCPRCAITGSGDNLRLHFGFKHGIVNQLYERDLRERVEKEEMKVKVKISFIVNRLLILQQDKKGKSKKRLIVMELLFLKRHVEIGKFQFHDG